WVVLALGAAGAIFGLNTRESLIYQVFGLSVGLIAVAALASMRFGIRATLARALPQLATAGTPFEYTVTLTNLDDRAYAPVLVEEILDGTRPTAREFVAFKVREDRSRN